MDSIQSILDVEIARTSAEKQKLRELKASPSNLWACPRKLMMMERGVESTPVDALTLRIFQCGFIFEDFVLNSLEKQGVLLRRQEQVEYRGMKGTLDSIIQLNGENVLFDVKSCKTEKFKYLDKEGVDMSYCMQLSFYHKAYKKDKLSPLGRIFYVEKNNLMIKELPIRCEDYYKKVDDKLTELENWRKEKELPPEKTEINWECFSVSQKFKTCKAWCPYIKNCTKINEQYVKQCKVFEK